MGLHDLLTSRNLGTAARWARSAAGVLAAVALVAVVAGTDPAAAASAKPSFFNSTEVRYTDMSPFKKWRAALQRFTKEWAERQSGGCDANTMTACHYDRWVKFVASIQDEDPVAQIRMVNAQMNKAKYVTDKANWGTSDYWATPGEFMARFGDCEDYAIIKYMSLRMLGFTDDQLRVVAVKDLNLKVGHAVLVVFLHGKTWVLDNQIKSVVEADRIRHYKPVFSINRKYWWRHT